MRSISLVGLMVFSFCFYTISAHPEIIEKMAKTFVITKAQLKADDFQKNDKVEAVADKALSIAVKFGFDQQKIQEKMDGGIDNYIRDSLSAICKFDCPDAIESNAVEQSRFTNFKFHGQSIMEALKDRYMKTIDLLVRDLRIFTGVNAIAFFVMLGMSFMKTNQPKALVIPWVFLLLSVVIASISYIGNSHWFYDILMNHFMGFGYLFYMAFIFGMLCDFVFNEAKFLQAIFYPMMGLALLSSF